MQLPHQEVEAPADGPRLTQDAPHLGQMRIEAVELLFHVETLAQQDHLLLEALRIELGLHLGEAAQARQRLPEVRVRFREKLAARLAEMKTELDPQRLEQEMVLLSQRLDVEEKLDRLEAHLAEVRRVLGQAGAVGRRLDFLMQELLREANTLGSKSADVETTRISVEMKVLIEQKREQVQNIE